MLKMKKCNDNLLTEAQLRTELYRCEYCEDKPCQKACPADCSPADFIMAARQGEPSDYRRAAALILGANPLGGVCGIVCPDDLCMQACARRTFDGPIPIPAIQATLIAKAKKIGLMEFRLACSTGKQVAVIGAGPAGLAAGALLAQKGFRVVVYDKRKKAGGMCCLIPETRLNRKALASDIRFITRLGEISFQFGKPILPSQLLATYDAVVVATGLDRPIPLSIPGKGDTVPWEDFLSFPVNYRVRNKRIAIVGGGAIAVDCAVTAREHGAATVDLLYRRRQEHMPLTSFERNLMQENGIDVISCVKVKRLIRQGKKGVRVELLSLILPPGREPRPGNFLVDSGSKPYTRLYDLVITAVGSVSGFAMTRTTGLFYAGDLTHGARTVVEAVASGKNAALAADAYMNGLKPPPKLPTVKSQAVLPGRVLRPIPLNSEFFGMPISSPFLLSAAPHTDGFKPIVHAYEAGWPGAIMKTAFDNVPIHIPGSYMFVFADQTYGNCDNVSGHPLERVCGEVESLVRQYPDRLTMASTGGPITGNDDADRKVWQSNTRMLETAGVMGIEYSLSCPQGGDGTKGDIVSQDAQTTAKVIAWILQAGDANVPKLFKLSGAVTSIRVIMQAVKSVFQQYPHKKAGVTLANSFPAMAFRANPERRWDEGIVVGMSGEGVLPISNLTLAKVAGMGMAISGNGGPMDYKAAANFLALGAETVQFCTIVMKYGLHIIEELQSGLSYLLQQRGMESVRDLIGSAVPQPITPFDELSSAKQVPSVETTLCKHCGNCTRCPYLAVSLNRRKVPRFDAARCIGCSLCVQKCFSGALFMRHRTLAELSISVDA